MGSGDEATTSSAYYRAFGLPPRWAMLAGAVVLAAGAVAGLVTVVVRYIVGDPLAESGFVIAWCVIALLLCAFYLGPVAFELALVDEGLLWQSPLLSGRIDLAEPQSVRPFGPYGILAVLSTASRPRILSWATAGFADFMDDVTAAAPHVQVRHGIYQRTGDWLAGARRRPKRARRSDPK